MRRSQPSASQASIWNTSVSGRFSTYVGLYSVRFPFHISLCYFRLSLATNVTVTAVLFSPYARYHYTVKISAFRTSLLLFVYAPVLSSNLSFHFPLSSSPLRAVVWSIDGKLRRRVVVCLSVLRFICFRFSRRLLTFADPFASRRQARDS